MKKNKFLIKALFIAWLAWTLFCETMALIPSQKADELQKESTEKFYQSLEVINKETAAIGDKNSVQKDLAIQGKKLEKEMEDLSNAASKFREKSLYWHKLALLNLIN